MPATPALVYQAVSSHLYTSWDFDGFKGKITWTNTLLIPLVATVISGAILFSQVVIDLWRKSRRNGSEIDASKSATVLTNVADREGPINRTKLYAGAHGGFVILSFKVVRLLGCISLFVMSLISVAGEAEGHRDMWKGVFNSGNLPEIGLATTYWYATFLSAVSLLPSNSSQTAVRHVNFILFTAFSVYLYRDVWPLATYTGRPVDISEGSILWVKIAVLTCTAFFIPLFVPRQYVPVDPKNPMEVPSGEQTASIFSLMTYLFLDPVMFEAYRVPHLPHTRLPPLCDYDHSKELTKAAFPRLDPFRGAKNRHLFFGLLQVFFWNYVSMSVSLTGSIVASFASPVALNRILNYLEGGEVFIRPWFWVVSLFLGPLLVSICFQWYIFIGTQTLARTQAILTELIFEHSLRIRFKAETEDTSRPSPSTVVTPADTPETGSIAEGSAGSDTQSMSTSTAATTTGTEMTNGKGKGKAELAMPAEAPAKEAKKKDNLVGKINTLVTVDVDTIVTGKDFLMVFIQVPLQLGLAIAFLYIVLGWAAIVGLVSIVLLLPAPGIIARLIQKIQGKKMEKTDARVDAVTETVGVLRMIKLFGWEQKMSKSLKEKRDEEMTWIFKDKMVSLLNELVNFMIPTVTMVVTYATYTLIMKQPLNASKVFSSMAVFDLVRGLLYRTSYFFTQLIKAKVSLDRVGKFLRETELLDMYSEETSTELTIGGQTDNPDVIGFNNAVFAWSKDAEDGAQTPSARSFKLRVDGSLTFKRNALNLIIGPTGSGKTSVLMALLGEMHFMPTSMDSWYSLPREGGVAYAAQESWVQNETIRENILFGAPYDEERYNKVIHQCALARDLELFNAGDKTEVGEKGLTLSGGQKARVTLARAVYSSAEIILLDDVLAALDVHTSKWVVNECLQGDLIRGRTILLVTHNVALTSPIADHIASIGQDGIMREVDDLSEFLAKDKKLARQLAKEEDAAKVEEEVVDTVKDDKKEGDGKLILAEEIVEGRVSWKAFKLYLKGLGGDHFAIFFTSWMSGIALMHGGNMFATWFLGLWGSQYEIHKNPEEVNVAHYLSIYSAILVGGVAFYGFATIVYNFGTQRASKYINARLIDSVLSATLRWLDETPASRVITRCTQDIATVDSALAWGFSSVVELVIYMIIKLTGAVLFTPIFLIPGIVIGALGMYLGNVYLKAQMSVKREMSNARSPVLSHFGAAIAGLTSIRAYSAQQLFKAESMKRIDHYTKVARTSYNLNRWIGIRSDLLGAIFTAALATYLLIKRNLNAANTGFSLSQALEFCSAILWLVRSYNDFEVQCNSLERIQSYLEIEHEVPSTEAGNPPASWPTSGELRVEKLSARYSATGPRVLHDISFNVKSGERIGIVGRTGSGKSSLTLSLLRCILTDGSVYYDGLPTSKLNLDALRSKITIIPQMPELLSGTLRRNLDPFDQHDDATLNSALRAAGLFTLQNETDEARLTLDSSISSGGNNLSVGQRQIIALARAIVRNSKLLILDEATSAIDHKTDSIIQSTLRNELGSDVTILTVAHRLQTIMDADKIMVLDAGRVVEYDSPQVLLQKKEGQFRSMVDGSEDKDALYDIAEKKASGSQ